MDRLPEEDSLFFQRLQDYVGDPLHLYGSVNRWDYFPQASDVDAAIFTSSMDSTVARALAFLQLPRTQIKEFHQTFSMRDQSVIHGRKLKHEAHPPFDLFIYHEKDRERVLENLRQSNQLPWFLVSLMFVLKSLYYRFHLIPKSWFVYCKNFLYYSYFNSTLRFYNKTMSNTVIL